VAEQNENPTTPVFSLEKIYIKDVSYEAPAVPHAFLVAEPPQIGVELSLDHSALDTAQGVFEVVLTVTVTAAREDKTVFLVELQQGGLFRIQGVDGELLRKTLEINCPHVLLPFAREAISDFLSKGGFPPMLLQPINFQTLYEQKLSAPAAPQPAQA